MAVSLTATFQTRRQAEMSIERMVQEFGIDRGAIFVGPEGSRNSVGEAQAGSDVAGVQRDDGRDDAPLDGAVIVSLEVEDAAVADKVRASFDEFNAAGIEADTAAG